MGSGGPVLHPVHQRIERVEAHRTRHMVDRNLRFAEVYVHPAAEVPRSSQVRIECQCTINQGCTIVEIAGDPGQREPACVQSNSILLRKPHSPLSKALSFGNLPRIVSPPAIVPTQNVAPCGHPKSRGKFGIEFGSPVELLQRLGDCLLRSSIYLMETRYPAQIAVVRIKALGRLMFCTNNLGLLQFRSNNADDTGGHLILKLEDVRKFALKAVGP